MSLDKLKRTVHREFTRNPAKSFTLLALIPVAGYFIVPVIWKQLPIAKGEKPSQPSFVAAAGNEPLAAAAGPAALPRWQDVAEWIVRDALMKPSTAALARDPFRSTSKPAKSDRGDEPRVAEAAPSAASLRPEDCGLQLTTTIIGPSKRLATINGRLYPENAQVRFDSSGERPADASRSDSAFLLKSVAKNHVMLERHGELFRLRLAGLEEK